MRRLLLVVVLILFAVTPLRAGLLRHVGGGNNKINIVFKGDSITYGTNASSGQGTTSGPVYPGVVMAGLTSGSGTFSSVNKGIAGERCDTMAGNAATEMQPLIRSDVELNIAVILCGVNDLACENDGTNSGCSTAAQVYSRISGYATTLQGYGYYVIVMTLLPANPSSYTPPPTIDSLRDTLNTSLRNGHSFAKALADPGGDATIGCDGCETNTTYYGSDEVHPTNAGYAILASYPQAVIQAAVNAQ